MKIFLGLLIVLLSGCASVNPDTQKSISRDKTMESMAKTALIAEMLNSPDPIVRAKGAEIAQQYLKEKKKGLFNF
jgi:PBP1b-binding outer membrane lipoprotein LpoB